MHYARTPASRQLLFVLHVSYLYLFIERYMDDTLTKRRVEVEYGGVASLPKNDEISLDSSHPYEVLQSKIRTHESHC